MLREICITIEAERKKKQPRGSGKNPMIAFVRAGEESKGLSQPRQGLLHSGNDWQMQGDIGKQLRFPPVVATTLRPDIVIWSEKQRKIIIVELTVPWEERCGVSHELKGAKYEDLLLQCRERGWATWNFPVEVGCRGFPAPSLGKMFACLGIQGKTKKAAVGRCAKATERASRWLWLQRKDCCWMPTAGGQ